MKDRGVSTGISRTSSGWRLYARIKGKLWPHRIYDPDHRLTLPELKDKLADWRVAARAPKAAVVSSTGFASDVRERYLPAVRSMTGIAERRYHMDLWIREFGSRPRAEIQPWEIARVRERWLTEGPKRICVPWKPGEKPADAKKHAAKWVEVAQPLSASQVNNRLRALQNFYTVLDGRHGPNPAREAGEAPEPESEARALDYGTVETILGKVPDTRHGKIVATKLRLRAIAYIGLSHGELRGIRPEDLHLDDPMPWVWVSGRKKGKGTKGTPQPLTPEGVDALRALADAEVLGPFSPDSMRQTFQRACAKADLHDLTPYQFRHSFAAEVFEKTGGNIGVTQLLMRHRDQRTTAIYVKKALDVVRAAALRDASAKGAFAKKVTGKLPARRNKTSRTRKKSK